MSSFILLMFIGLEIKHFVADYLLQSRWMIKGKQSLSHPGGYLHAGVHALGTAIILFLMTLSVPVIVMVVIAEFAVHYVIDYGKVKFGANITSSEHPRLFWALNGLDQLFHHLTYVAIIFFIGTIVGG